MFLIFFMHCIFPEWGHMDVFCCCLYHDRSWQKYNKECKHSDEAADLYGCQESWAGLGLYMMPWYEIILFMFA